MIRIPSSGRLVFIIIESIPGLLKRLQIRALYAHIQGASGIDARFLKQI